jgi:hypothetical protein
MPKLTQLIIALGIGLGLIASIITIELVVVPYINDLNYPPQLSQESLKTFETGMQSRGYSVTQPLTYSGENNDGSRQYQGTLTRTGLTYNYYLYQYKDVSSGSTRLSNEVALLQGLGFRTANVTTNWWLGQKILSDGTPLQAGVMQEQILGTTVVTVVWFDT